MKKSSKLLLTLSLMGLGVTALASCSSSFVNPFTGDGLAFDGETESNEGTVTTYSIENVAAEYAYLDGLPEKGEAGKAYSFRVTLKPGYHFNDKVTVYCGENTIDVTQEGDTYTFVMPEGDVEVVVDVGQTNFTITNDCYFVSEVLLDDEAGNTAVTSAFAGTPLKFEAVADIDFSFTEVTINGVVAEEGDDGFYHFVMPVRPVKIASDKNAISYDVAFKTELKNSTVAVYKDVETKEEITEAIKGETIYVEFATESEHMQYTLTAKTVVEEGETATELKVTPVDESGKLFSFTMISDNIDIEVVEDDRTLYFESSVVGKTWNCQNVYGSSGDPSSRTYSQMSTYSAKLNSDGTAKAGSNKGTWKISKEGEAEVYVPSGSTTKTLKAVWTDNIIGIQYAGTTPSWKDAYFGVADDTYAIHYFVFDSSYRIVWIEDSESAIVESMVIIGEEIYVNPTIVLNDEEGTAAKGSDITKTSSFIVKDGEDEILRVDNAKATVTSAITTKLAEYVSCEIFDADGNAVTSGVYGKKITIKPSLSEDAPSSLVIKTPVVTDKYGNKISLSTVSGADGEIGYTFTMPMTATKIAIDTKDTSVFINHSALGTYYSYEMWSTSSADRDYTSFSTEIIVKEDGTVTKGGYSFEISEISEGDEGTFKAVSSTGTEYDYCYSNGIIVTPYSSFWNDIWVGVRLPEGHEKSEISNNVHYGENNGTKSSWAMTLFLGDEVFGSVFCFEGEMYMGVSFVFDEGSTRINSTSSYHVVKDGVTLFDVSNNVFTKHVA